MHSQNEVLVLQSDNRLLFGHGQNFKVFVVKWSEILTMAELLQYPWSNSQDFDHDHCQNQNGQPEI